MSSHESSSSSSPPSSPRPPPLPLSAAVLGAVQAPVDEHEQALMMQLYQEYDPAKAAMTDEAIVPLPQGVDQGRTLPPLPPWAPKGSEASVAWDMQRKTFVWESSSGQPWVWRGEGEGEEGEWVEDEEMREEMDHLQDEAEEEEAGVEMEGVKEKVKEEGEKREEEGEKRKRKKKRKRPNRSLYVTGLPPDVTELELGEWFKKAGVIEKDPETLRPKVRVYLDEEGRPKGDGLVTFLREEAVSNAFLLLDGADLRLGRGPPLTLSEPQYDPTKKARKEQRPAPGKRRKFDQTKELGWEEEEQRHVVLKHLFEPEQALKGGPTFYDDLKRDLMPELLKCGPIESVRVFERSPEGVVAVKFESDWAAAQCVETMQDRYFDGRRLKAEYYDGYSDYFVPESEEEKAVRDQAWSKWLEGNDDYDERVAHEQRLMGGAGKGGELPASATVYTPKQPLRRAEESSSDSEYFGEGD